MRLPVIALCLAVAGGCGNDGPQMVTVDVFGPGSVSSTPAGIDCSTVVALYQKYSSVPVR